MLEIERRDIIIAVLVLLCGVLLWLTKCQRDKAMNYQNIAEAQTDTLETARNRLGQQTAQILAFEADRKAFLSQINQKDSTIRQLQNLVRKKDAKMAAIVETQTVDTGTTQTVIKDTDTIEKTGGLQYVYPTYYSDWDNKWSQGRILADRDTILRDVKFRNRLEMWHSKEGGLFQKKKLTFFVKNLNPNTTTTEARSYSVPVSDRKWFGVGIQVGYGYGLRSQQFQPYIGVGVDFNIISW